MALKADFQDTLQTFIFLNLPTLMNSSNVMNVVVSSVVESFPISSTPTMDTTSLLIITPEILNAIQAYVLDNFPDIGLPQDIQQIANIFFANLPPDIPRITRTNTADVTS